MGFENTVRPIGIDNLAPLLIRKQVLLSSSVVQPLLYQLKLVNVAAQGSAPRAVEEFTKVVRLTNVSELERPLPTVFNK